MIRIANTQAAFDMIAATLPLGSVGYEVEADASRRFCRSLDDGPLPDGPALVTDPSTFKGSVAEEPVPIAERRPSSKGWALTSSREIAIWSPRFAFALSTRPPIGLDLAALIARRTAQ
jgi:hypothetical protein